jgi:hypothetical protein
MPCGYTNVGDWISWGFGKGSVVGKEPDLWFVYLCIYV